MDNRLTVLCQITNKKLSCCFDSRSYCVRRRGVRCTWKLSHRFRLQVYEWQACISDTKGRVYERIQTLSTQAWPLSVTDQSSVVHKVSEWQNVTRPVHAWLSVSKKTDVCVFFNLFFFNAFCSQTTHPTAKVTERTNRNMLARNTLVQLLALYTNPESHDLQRHRQTDGRTDRWTDITLTPITDWFWVAWFCFCLLVDYNVFYCFWRYRFSWNLAVKMVYE